MGPTPESAGITAQLRLPYRIGVFWMNLKSVGELCPRQPDSSEIHPTPHRDRYLPTEQVQCTQLQTYRSWVGGVIT